MPAFSTHYLFAKDCTDKIRRLDGELKLDENMLFFGTQGPDIFFFHRLFPTMKGKSLRKIGSMMHRADPSSLFNAMAEFIRTGYCDVDKVKSYAYGFLLHYSLDRAVHPYVYAQQAEIAQKENIKYPVGIIHNRIEFNIDMLLLNQKLGVTDPRKFLSYKTLKIDDYSFSQAAKMLQFVIEKVFSTRLSVELIKFAFYDTVTVQRLLSDEKGFKLPLLYALQAPLYPFLGPCLTTMVRRKHSDGRWDYLNRENRLWAFPADKSIESNMSVEQLYRKAFDDVDDLVTRFNQTVSGQGNMDAVTQHRSFLTGLPV